MSLRISVLFVAALGNVPLYGVILPGIDRSVFDFGVVGPGEPDLATLILPVLPSVQSLVVSEPVLDRTPRRITDELPRLESPRRLGAGPAVISTRESGVPDWNLRFNSSFASAVYDRFDSAGFTGWANRLETGMEFGRADFRPDSFAAIRDVDSFRTSVQQNPAYSYGAPGF